MNKNIIVGIVAVVIFLGGTIFILSRNGNGTQNTVNTPASTSTAQTNTATTTKTTTTTTTTTTVVPKTLPVIITPAPAPAPTSFTMVQVQMHNSKSDCWSVVNGKVYNLTSWIGQHPGGKSAILSMCGKDGSAGFNDQHGGQSRPANELDGFFIGALSN